MKILKNKRLVISTIVLFVLMMAFFVYQILYLRNAHSTFDNYYKFRGCTQIIEKTDTYGICKTNDGKEIKLVLFEGKWYLDGDLPCGFMCF